MVGGSVVSVGVVVVRRAFGRHSCVDLRGLVADRGLELGRLRNLLQHYGEPRFERLDEHDVHAVEAEQLKILRALLDDAIGAGMRIVGLSVGWEPTVLEGSCGRAAASGSDGLANLAHRALHENTA